MIFNNRCPALAAWFILVAILFTASPATGRVATLVGNPAPVSPLFTGCGGVTVPSMNPDYEQQVFNLVNQKRSEFGLSSLSRSTALDAAARYHAEDMAQDNYFNHDTFDSGNPDPICPWFERVSAYYPDYSYLSENIAAGYQTPDQVVAGWMGSAGHRENILSQDIREIGIGYALQTETGSTYWVQDFGNQSNQPVLGNIPSDLNFAYSIPEHRLYPSSAGIFPENTGNGYSLTWSVNGDSGWLQITPIQGVTQSGFSLSPSEFDPNTPAEYTGSITVTVTDPGGTLNSPATITVHFHVVDAPFKWIYLPQVMR